MIEMVTPIAGHVMIRDRQHIIITVVKPGLDHIAVTVDVNLLQDLTLEKPTILEGSHHLLTGDLQMLPITSTIALVVMKDHAAVPLLGTRRPHIEADTGTTVAILIICNVYVATQTSPSIGDMHHIVFMILESSLMKT